MCNKLARVFLLANLESHGPISIMLFGICDLGLVVLIRNGN